MKNRTDKTLLAVFLLSLPACAFLLLIFLGIIDLDLGWSSALRGRLAVTLPVVPAFCLQLLLCRRVWRWIAVLPALLTTGVVVWFTYGACTATGWDSVGWLILLLLCAAPAAGIVLAWAAYGLHRLYRQRRPI